MAKGVIDTIAEGLRNDTLKVCYQIARKEIDEGKGYHESWNGQSGNNVYDMGSFEGAPDGEYPDNYGTYMKKIVKVQNAAWCKYFITKVVMPKVKQINPNGKGRENADGVKATGRAAISTSDKSQKTYKFPVPGMIWFKHKSKSNKNNEGSGHVGVVVDVDYNTGTIKTLEGNTTSTINGNTWNIGQLKRQNAYFYPIWTEDEDSLRAAADKKAGFSGASESFENKLKNAKEDKSRAKHWSSNTNYPTSTSDNGTSSSEKQPFEIPYMTVAEATDYLKNLSNPNQGNGNGTTTGQLGIDALPQS